MKKHIYIPILTCLGLFGCAGMSPLEPTVVSVLSAIQSASSKLAASGAVPAGKSTDVVNDASTITNALETINTGAGITPQEATDVAASFKSNASTTGYIQLAAAISDVLVPFVDDLIKSGLTPAQVQTNTTQALVNIPAAVAAGTSPTAVAAYLKSHLPVVVRTPAQLRAPYGEHDWQHVEWARK
jgi:hypothetical protein